MVKNNNDKKAFLRFLKNFKLYELYMRNRKFSRTTMEYVFNSKPERFLDRSFTWDLTAQRHLFWAIVNAIWTVYFCKLDVSKSVGYTWLAVYNRQGMLLVDSKVAEFKERGYSMVILES